MAEVLSAFSDNMRLVAIGIFTSEHPDAAHTVDEDSDITEILFEYACELVDCEMLVSLFYTCRPPARFFAALDKGGDGEAQLLQWCSWLWPVFESLEKEATHDPGMASYQRDMLWPLSVWGRETFCGLREAKLPEYPEGHYEEHRRHGPRHVYDETSGGHLQYLQGRTEAEQSGAPFESGSLASRCHDECVARR